MKVFFIMLITFLVLIVLITCYGLGTWLMYKHGWIKSFYVSLAAFLVCASVCVIVIRDTRELEKE